VQGADDQGAAGKALGQWPAAVRAYRVDGVHAATYQWLDGSTST
jgi:hypothetical protein